MTFAVAASIVNPDEYLELVESLLENQIPRRHPPRQTHPKCFPEKRLRSELLVRQGICLLGAGSLGASEKQHYIFEH